MEFEEINTLCTQAASAKSILDKLSKMSLRLSDIPHQQGEALSKYETRLAARAQHRISLIAVDPTILEFDYSYSQSERILHVVQGKVLIIKLSMANGKLMPTTAELINTGESIMIDSYIYHNLTAWGGESSTLLEIQIGVEPLSVNKIMLSPEATTRLDQLKNQIKDYYYGYDKRYQEVYEQGADLWESHEPNEVVRLAYQNYPHLFTGKIIDLGCGEGRDALYLAGHNCDILGVDVSRVALDKARSIASKHKIHINFLERDVIFLRNIPNDSFDLAINMGCLHMLSDQEHRKLNLARTFEILKPSGHLLLAHCKQNWGKGFFSIPHYDELGPLKPGETIQRRIRVADQEKFIPLEVVPYKESSEEELYRELKEAGFSIEEIINQSTDAFGNSVVVIAKKP